MSNATPEFKEFNNGTQFMAQQVWIDDNGLVAGGIGVWEWAQASAVLGPTVPRIFPDAQYPVCSVLWSGQHLHIRAEFKQVLTAYLRYKQRYQNRFQFTTPN